MINLTVITFRNARMRSNEKVTLLSARYFKHDIHLYEYAVVNNSIRYPDGTKGNGYDYERWFLAQGVEIIDLSK